MDVLRSTYRFSCPHRGEAEVRLSAFRTIERLPGASHPVVYRVTFTCSCGDEHVGLLTHAELDWEPLGLDAGVTFVNLMTNREDALALELGSIALARLRAGEWPWSFFCFPEERARPVTPSSFTLVAPGLGRACDHVAVAVRCPVCDALSVNVVSEAHVDYPFWNDARVTVVEHVFRSDALRTLDSFRAELYSASFDERRLSL